MDDIISRAAAKRAINEYKNSMIGLMPLEINRIVDLFQIILKLPAVDAVSVVRCKDCKYGEQETNGFEEDMVMCQNKQNPIGYEDWLMPPEFFCADGERRDEDAAD